MKIRSKGDGKGCYIPSLPLGALVELSKSENKRRRWTYVDGWLFLEG